MYFLFFTGFQDNCLNSLAVRPALQCDIFDNTGFRRIARDSACTQGHILFMNIFNRSIHTGEAPK